MYNRDITKNNALRIKIMKTKPSLSLTTIFTLIGKLSDEIVAYDNPSHSEDFREAIRDAVKALRNLRKFF